MKKREYTISEASWVLMLGVFFATLILSSILLYNIQITIALPKGIMGGVIEAASIFMIAVLMTKLIAFSKTKIILVNNEINVQRRSWLGWQAKTNFNLHYSKIEKHEFHLDMYWYWLKIVDKKGRTYRIWKFATYNNTQFKNFRDRFNNEMKWYNQNSEDLPNYKV